MAGILSHPFQGAALRTQALTHPSAPAPHYQRLEFLGDRVLNLVVAAMLYEAFPEANEGDLGLRHAALVSTSTLAEVGEAWGLPNHIIRGPAEVNTPLKPTILADVVEALLGAVYLEGGLPAAEIYIRQTWQPLLMAPQTKDAKTELQEVLQAAGHPLPTYTTLEEEGPSHARTFTVQVACALGQATGQGAGKQAAQTHAAHNLLKTLAK